MPKRQNLLHIKQKRSKPEGPESENEYLAAGVDFEEAGEKWRAGDAVKSLRFFTRAIDTYDVGLQMFPRSYDLAYNKSRIQYNIAQQPRLLEHLPGSLIDLLKAALESHRVALDIEHDSPDLLFNTAQVSTSLAEAIIEDRRQSEDERIAALRLLQEALELLQRCRNLQGFRYEQAQKDAAQMAEEPTIGGSLDPSIANGSSSDAPEEEVWTSIEEPITKDTLLDTAIAQFDTLTTLCNLGDVQGHSGLAWIEEFYRNELQNKVDDYLAATSRQHEVALAKAKFVSAISDAAFRIGRLDLLTYEREITAAFNNPELILANDPQGLCDRADAELTFNANIQSSSSSSDLEQMASVATICWKHITRALDSLTAASKLPDALNLPRIHLRKGDCEMLRLCLGEAPLRYDLATKSSPTLLRNAEIYYRGAGALAKQSKADAEEQMEAEVKEVIASFLGGDAQRLGKLMTSRHGLIETTAHEMREEGLLSEEALQKLNGLLLQGGGADG